MVYFWDRNADNPRTLLGFHKPATSIPNQRDATTRGFFLGTNLVIASINKQESVGEPPSQVSLKWNILLWKSLQVETAKCVVFVKINHTLHSWVPNISNSLYLSTTGPIIRQHDLLLKLGFLIVIAWTTDVPSLASHNTSHVVLCHTALPNWGDGKSLFNLWRELSRLRRTFLAEKEMDTDLLVGKCLSISFSTGSFHLPSSLLVV